MSVFSTNEFKSGLKVMLDGDPCSIMENEYVKPGKGQAFNRVKLRNLKNGRVIERTFKSGDTLDGADVLEMDMQYLYFDGEFWHFMAPDTFEQFTAGKTAMSDAAKWIKEQDLCHVIVWNGSPLIIEPPIFVTLKVIETEPGIRGDTATGGTKAAKVETGTIVRVPLFVNEGDLLKIDTRNGSYVSRANK